MRQLIRLLVSLFLGVILVSCSNQNKPVNNSFENLLFSSEDISFPQSLIWTNSLTRTESNDWCNGKWLIREVTNKLNPHNNLISGITECLNTTEAVKWSNFVLLPHSTALSGSTSTFTHPYLLHANSFNGLCETLPMPTSEGSANSQNVRECRYVARYDNTVIELVMTNHDKENFLSEQEIFNYFINKVDAFFLSSSK